MSDPFQPTELGDPTEFILVDVATLSREFSPEVVGEYWQVLGLMHEQISVVADCRVAICHNGVGLAKSGSRCLCFGKTVLGHGGENQIETRPIGSSFLVSPLCLEK